MNNYFEDLLEIMAKEHDLYRELKSIEEKKSKIITNNDVEALEAITKKEQGFVKTIVHLEEHRAEVIDGFCRVKGIRKVNTIDDILKVISKEEAKKLKNERDKLYAVTMEVKEVNQLNNMLINQSIDYINYTMEIARSLSEEDFGYDKNRTDRKVKVDNNIFDAKV